MNWVNNNNSILVKRREIGHFQVGLAWNMLALASGALAGGVFLAWNFTPRSQ